jgi:hypothetical protein
MLSQRHLPPPEAAEQHAPATGQNVREMVAPGFGAFRHRIGIIGYSAGGAVLLSA